MDFRIFKTYYQLSVFDNKFPEILCKVDAEHMSLIPYLDIDENIYLECYAHLP